MIGNTNDNTIVGGSKANTLDGGATSDDVLTGGKGEDVFVVTVGNGNDTITDYEEGTDMILLGKNTTISKAVAKGDDFVFTLTKGSSKNTLTVQNAKDKIINVTDADGTEVVYNYKYKNTNSSKYVVAEQKFVEDTWFTQDNQNSTELESILPVTETDYSVGKIDTVNDLTKSLDKIAYNSSNDCSDKSNK